MKVSRLRFKAFTATILVPAGVPDGTSLEEKLEAWRAGQGSREIVEVQYASPATGEYTALVIYTEG